MPFWLAVLKPPPHLQTVRDCQHSGLGLKHWPFCLDLFVLSSCPAELSLGKFARACEVVTFARFQSHAPVLLSWHSPVLARSTCLPLSTGSAGVLSSVGSLLRSPSRWSCLGSASANFFDARRRPPDPSSMMGALLRTERQSQSISRLALATNCYTKPVEFGGMFPRLLEPPEPAGC